MEASGANEDATWDFSEIHQNEDGFIVSAQDLYSDGVNKERDPCLDEVMLLLTFMCSQHYRYKKFISTHTIGVFV